MLERALELWEREGEQGFNVHAIARASDASVGSLYHHFGSMDGLAAHLYARCLAALLDRIIDALDGARTPKQLVTAIVEGYLAFTKESPARARFIHASAYARFLPAHAALVAAAKAPRLEVIRASLRPHVAKGRIVPLSEPLMEMVLIGP
ncbi:TetR/AcrR family transcriptional regulator, partial [Myxococcota bacterium]|nr:TetR/AcrR family transcriptional regulator [Myxococcota bacterium]